MNILVTGANGQLGRELRNRAEGSGQHFIFSDVSQVSGLDTLYLDITNLDATRIVCNSENVDVIINCAAYTDVEKAEDDIEFAELLNHHAVANLATVCRERGAAMVHISTDYVFHGDSCVPYREDAEPRPLGVYGATKLQGEEAIRKSGCRYMIVRTAWLYSPYGRNFVKTVRRLCSEGRPMRCVSDQVGTPTYAWDLAGFLMEALAKGLSEKGGIYHFTDEGVCSWYDFAVAVYKLSGGTESVTPCHTEDYPTKAARPHYSVLDKSKVKRDFDIAIPHWYESLCACIERMEDENY